MGKAPSLVHEGHVQTRIFYRVCPHESDIAGVTPVRGPPLQRRVIQHGSFGVPDHEEVGSREKYDLPIDQQLLAVRDCVT